MNGASANSAPRNEKTYKRDILSLGIAIAALILFVGSAGALLPQIARSWMSGVDHTSSALANAVLLNIALILFGWRRYKELSGQVSKHKEREAEARLLAETDPLTGCLNRRSIAPNAERLIAEAESYGQSVAALMLDVDNFKLVNDLNGHSIGDKVLTGIAQRIRAAVPEDALLARLGGDEFAVIFPFDPKMPDKVDQQAVRVIDEIASFTEIAGVTLDISASIGIARNDSELLEDDDPTDPQNLIHRADIAMYHAKKQGRGRHYWFELTMESELRFRHELETGIRRGIARGEFVPFYEQQIDLATGELQGFEMLARWQSPKLGVVGPDVFIPVAEEMGLISQLSESLIRQALQDAKQWDPKLTLSVNISPIQLRDPWFSQKLLRLLVESGFPPNRLDIEITESCIHENIGVVRSVVTSLKNQGIHISLDDFGTGYSSLAQLRSLPFDRLKIDRSFVRELAETGGNSKIVEAIVTLGRGLELPVTAEGIENDEVLKVLSEFGELKGQGYLYGRPEDAFTTLKRLAEQHLLAEIEDGEVDTENSIAKEIEEEAATEPKKAKKSRS